MVSVKLALFALASAVIADVASAAVEPRHTHRPRVARNRHQMKRDQLTVTHTIMIDQHGNTITLGQTPATTPSALLTAYVPGTTTSTLKNLQTSSPASSGSGTPADGYFGKAIVYSPYHNDGTCKSAVDVATDFADIMGTGATNAFAGVRLYGVDCDQVKTVLPVARKMKFKVMLGIYDITQAAANAQTIIDAVGGDWGVVHSVGVGNEDVNKGILNGGDGNVIANNVMAAVARVKRLLKPAGYTGPVVNPEVFFRFAQFPQLCGTETWLAANAHPFFDGSVTAPGAGAFLTAQSAAVTKACNKPVLITETGWPSKGDANGVAVPSTDNQNLVVTDACSALGDNLVLLGAFNDYWKSNFEGSFGAEENWGILGNSVTN